MPDNIKANDNKKIRAYTMLLVIGLVENNCSLQSPDYRLLIECQC